jgi:RHS repeat-associated protein
LLDDQARDHLFSPAVAIATADGTITERYEYDAYGKPYIVDADYTGDGSSDIGNPYLFTGRRLDTLDSGAFLIQYSRARYYDYDTGRWYQRDPLNQDKPGGGYQNGMGLYEYVKGSPANYSDSLGLSCASEFADCTDLADIIASEAYAAMAENLSICKNRCRAVENPGPGQISVCIFSCYVGYNAANAAIKLAYQVMLTACSVQLAACEACELL